MKRFFILVFGLVFIAAAWLVWYSTQPQSKEVRATRTFVQVNAPPDKVWQVLTDTAAYIDWNPYVASVLGTPSLHAKLHIKEVVGGRTHRHTVQVSQFDPTQHLMAWHGSLWPSRLLSWDEGFRVEASDSGGSIVVISRGYQGLLLPLYWKIFNPYDLEGIRQMGSALKQRSEK